MRTFTQRTKKAAMTLAMALGLIGIATSANAALVPVTFKVDMTGINMTGGTGVYVVGELGGTMQWVHQSMSLEQNNVYAVTVNIEEGTKLYYYFTIHTDWTDAMREAKPLPAPCASTGAEKTGGWAGDRFLEVPVGGTTVSFPYSGCGTATGIIAPEVSAVVCTPNPANDFVTITLPETAANAKVELIDLGGKKAMSVDVAVTDSQAQINVSALNAGIYVVVITTNTKVYTTKLSVK
jgi:hypothetical protein